jgi:hypothetical protein
VYEKRGVPRVEVLKKQLRKFQKEFSSSSGLGQDEFQYQKLKLKKLSKVHSYIFDVFMRVFDNKGSFKISILKVLNSLREKAQSDFLDRVDHLYNQLSSFESKYKKVKRESIRRTKEMINQVQTVLASN